MKDYNNELDCFYDTEYKPCMKKNGDISVDSEFGIDGLLKRPVGRGGEESELWDKCQLRILFLLKDKNANDSCIDSRSYRNINNNFGKNIAAWIYAIFQIYNKNGVPSIKEAYDKEKQIETFQQRPFAIINVKKKVGKETVKDKCIREYGRRYAAKIKSEIDILHPNIILCCGGTKGLITTLAMENIYHGYSFRQEGTNGLIYYCNEENILLVKTYHPSIRKKREHVFCNVVNDLKEFFDNHLFP